MAVGFASPAATSDSLKPDGSVAAANGAATAHKIARKEKVRPLSSHR
jgi:hypothetical protein